MNDIVVDSSVVTKWILPEPDSAHALRLITEVPANGGRLFVLDLAFSEVANAIWKRHRQKLITLAEARTALSVLKGIPVHVQSATRLLDQAFEIGLKYDRAIYDAMFVALAHDLGGRGVTDDGPLYNTTHADFPQIILLRDWP